MKRALITTLHFYHNYGSVLQAFALRHVLEKWFGYEADIFPFRPRLPEYRYFFTKELEDGYARKIKKFDFFRQQELGVKGHNASDIQGAFSMLGRKPEDYDAFIAGSDIIWGKEFSALAEPYFLKQGAFGKPRVAYAASMLMDEQGHSEDDVLFSEGIKNFTDIGMRETSSVSFVQRFREDISVESVLDPTLLLDADDYGALEQDYEAVAQGPYLLSYFLTHDPAVVDYTNMMAKKLGLRVMHYFADYPDRVFGIDDGCFAFTGPGEFLSLIKNAVLVFTNSFHGTCFSMIYRKPFYTYMAKRNMLSRVKDTVERLGMEGRYYTDFRDLERVTVDVGYQEMEIRLKKHREKSLSFLRHALEAQDAQ